ncbi:DinB family protein [Paenibacillus sp. YPG26]|uniref:DinB family protein n=1 Tax=Paenibacillus sp. YPG26 TaxID=2878915 RepID=UPI00203AB162|nr:DinB family protein [Paenibacillus sp. YPG26]USB32111.1 DinB family protein [Paenibacillus sp. YPG26]
MFTTLKSFEESWKHESAMTGNILNALTDESLSQAIAPNHRTLGRIAWHIVTTLHEMLSRTGLVFEAPHEDAPVPATASAIAESYRQASTALSDAIRQQWTDSTLAETAEMYGDTWSKGLTLAVVINHQAHHRGQMTVLMRQAGLAVPGVYGPSLEEWSTFGMQPPVV